MTSRHVLLTGATGYVGGTVLNTLLKSNHNSLQNLEISVLVRGEEKGKVLAGLGVKPIYFNSLDDSGIITKAASENDIVINTASSTHPGAAKALILGLSQRKKTTGTNVFYFHTSGTSSIGDNPLTKKYYEPRILSDTDDLYTYLELRETLESYIQRTTDLVAINTGLEVNVPTYVIMPPTIYGLGSGIGNRTSIQLPNIIRSAIKSGNVNVLGAGTGTWDTVHVEDLAQLYELLLRRVIVGDDIPSGKQGIFFAETGDYTWLQLSQGLANELANQGVLKSNEVKHLSLKEAADLGTFTGGNVQLAELAFASNSRSRADLSRKLGWKPTRTRGDFFESFKEEVKTVAAETN